MCQPLEHRYHAHHRRSDMVIAGPTMTVVETPHAWPAPLLSVALAALQGLPTWPPAALRLVRGTVSATTPVTLLSSPRGLAGRRPWHDSLPLSLMIWGVLSPWPEDANDC
jgi:hypothetical protein